MPDFLLIYLLAGWLYFLVAYRKHRLVEERDKVEYYSLSMILFSWFMCQFAWPFGLIAAIVTRFPGGRNST